MEAPSASAWARGPWSDRSSVSTRSRAPVWRWRRRRSQILDAVVQLLDAFALPRLVIQSNRPLTAGLVEARDVSGFGPRDRFVDRLDPLFDMILVAVEDDRGTVECHALWPRAAM